MPKATMVLMVWVVLGQFISTPEAIGKVFGRGTSATGMSLKAAYVDYIHPVKSLCDCRKVCFAIPNCTSASVSEDALKCNVSYRPFAWDNLAPSSGAAVTYVWPPEYEPYGERYYKVYEASDYGPGKKRCLDDMGQLAILDTPEKFVEVTKYLESKGLDIAWIGLFIYNPAGSEPPVWQYREANVSSTGITWISWSRCFHVTKFGGTWSIKNAILVCNFPLQPVCQRDF
ncbi:uncharacterized protein LOC135204486 [Macrobrachium nipponense]|uniref:uncharacterized protein LOC135204486 n=1 Tax=Macrobrachium nipponense TaxID=159736 RepID=UPI0030C7E978